MQAKVFKNKWVYATPYLDPTINDLIYYSVKQAAEFSEDNKAISSPKKEMAFFPQLFLWYFIYSLGYDNFKIAY